MLNPHCLQVFIFHFTFAGMPVSRVQHARMMASFQKLSLWSSQRRKITWGLSIKWLKTSTCRSTFPKTANPWPRSSANPVSLLFFSPPSCSLINTFRALMANILPPKPIDSRRESVDCVTECSKNKRNSAKTADRALRLLQMGSLLLVMCR